MYLARTLLPQFSNREDFLLTAALFDDDTGQPIKIDGCFTASGQAFTSSAWTVVDGNIITTSATQFTIPAFPIGNQLSALALTVGAGLAIKAGDPVIILDTATGNNKVIGYVTSYGNNSGTLVVQIGVTFQFEIRRSGPRNNNLDDFSPFFYVGMVLNQPPLITASLGLPSPTSASITHVDTGLIQIRVPQAIFRQLNHRTFQVALVMTDSIDTRQIFVGELPVLYGGVSGNSSSSSNLFVLGQSQLG
jgi:hypothetical protein